MRNRLTSGRFLTATDTNAVVLAKNYAEERRLSAGSRFLLAGKEYTVAGILDPSGAGGLYPAQVYLPLSQAQAIAAAAKGVRAVHDFQPGSVNLLFLAVDPARQDEIIAEAKRLLGKGANVTAPASFQKKLGLLASATDHYARAFVVALCMVSAVLILRITSAGLQERRGDMALLSAIGWRQRDVRDQLLLESAAPLIAGTTAGAAVLLAAMSGLRQITLKLPIGWEQSPRPHFLPGGGDALYREVALSAGSPGEWLPLALLVATAMWGAGILWGWRRQDGSRVWNDLRD